MKNGKDFPVTFMPDSLAISLVFLIIGFFWLKLFLIDPTSFSFKFFPYFFLLNLIITLYFLYYFFVYSKIVIFKDKVILPKTNFSGFPSAFIFQKKEIDIYSITKIIKYPVQYGKVSVSPRLAFHGAKAAVISKTVGNIQLSYGFYGVGKIENLILEILNRNENIQILENN